MIVVRTITSPLTLSVSEQLIKSCRTLVRSPVIRTLFGRRQTSRSPQCLFISKFLNSWLEAASDQVLLNFEYRLWSTIGLFDLDPDSERVLNLVEPSNMFAPYSSFGLMSMSCRSLESDLVFNRCLSTYFRSLGSCCSSQFTSPCLHASLVHLSRFLSFMISFFRWI